MNKGARKIKVEIDFDGKPTWNMKSFHRRIRQIVNFHAKFKFLLVLKRALVVVTARGKG